MWHGKKKKPAPQAPAPEVPNGERLVKKGWLELFHTWQTRRKAQVLKTQPSPEVIVRAARVMLNGYSSTIPSEWSLIPSGLSCGTGSDVLLECIQLLHPGEVYIHTSEMLERAKGFNGFRGDACGVALAAQEDKIPTEWQGRRLYCIGNFAVDPQGNRWICKLEYNGLHWLVERVLLDLNVWPRRDYFIRQLV